MEIDIKRLNDEKVVVSPAGEINFDNSQDLKKELLALYNENYNVITVDFSSIESIDSSGLGKLLLFHKKLREKNGKLNIKNVQSDKIRKMFSLIHLDKVIEIED